jgi:hypothetical protein
MYNAYIVIGPKLKNKKAVSCKSEEGKGGECFILQHGNISSF